MILFVSLRKNGLCFKEDNKHVLNVLKKLLLNKQAYNHIATACEKIMEGNMFTT